MIIKLPSALNEIKLWILLEVVLVVFPHGSNNRLKAHDIFSDLERVNCLSSKNSFTLTIPNDPPKSHHRRFNVRIIVAWWERRLKIFLPPFIGQNAGPAFNWWMVISLSTASLAKTLSSSRKRIYKLLIWDNEMNCNILKKRKRKFNYIRFKRSFI